MKKVLLAAAAVILFVSNVHADPSEKLLRLFTETFPNAKNVKWSENKNIHVVTFIQKDTHLKIWYDNDGNFLSSLRYLQEKDLPLKVLLSVMKRYKDKHVFGVVEHLNENGISYHLTLSDDKKWYIVHASPDGSLSLAYAYRKS